MDMTTLSIFFSSTGGKITAMLLFIALLFLLVWAINAIRDE